MSSNSTKPQISTGSSCISLPINQIAITKEYLKSALGNTYEAGVKDTSQFRLRKLGSIFLSISGTLFITCLTSTFNDYQASVGFNTQKWFPVIAWVLLGLFFVGGLILVSLRDGEGDVFERRDDAVNGELAKIKNQ